MSDLSDIADIARTKLDAAHAAREKGLAASRQIIRTSANAIRAVHRGDRNESQALIAEARRLVEEARSAMADHPGVLWAGFFQDAEKEYAEACLTSSLVGGAGLLGPDEVGVPVVSYMGGLAETVGELRRHLLDTLRTGEVGRAEEILSVMDDIFYVLTSMDYPDALTRGLRSRTDAARGILERSRSDLTATATQQELVGAIATIQRELAELLAGLGDSGGGQEGG